MFFRTKSTAGRRYLQIVESCREGDRVRQRVVATLGRLEKLQETGALESLLRSGARFARQALVLDAARQGTLAEEGRRGLGAPLVFERLWRDSGAGEVIRSLAAGTRFEFDVERAVFGTVLHRLCAPGSDRAGEKWQAGQAIAGTAELRLHHLYRAMSWLGQPLAEPAGEGAPAPRCTKDLVEERLFRRHRDLFTGLDLVFFDTTSLYFEGAGGETLGRNGHSKDHRPDLKQMVVGAVLDSAGRPICNELWPGNTADVTTLRPVAERLRERFGAGQPCLVADRGMISRETISWLEGQETPWPYILGARLRRQKEVAGAVLGRAGRYREVYPERTRAKDPSPLAVKEVRVEGRRYVVCRNEEQARRDAAVRETILAALEEQLQRGDKSLVGNRGYRRFLKARGARFEIDRAKVAAEARYDGKWVLRTNTVLDPAEVALKYKQLWLVEDLHRQVKSVLETRPVFHQHDANIRGHVFCSFLALVLLKELQDRLAAAGLELEWADVIRDLGQLAEHVLIQDGKRFAVRLGLTGCAGPVFRAVGVALPPMVRLLD